MNSIKSWENNGMTFYPENHVNKSRYGFVNNKPNNWVKKFINKFFKNSTTSIIKKQLEILRNESQ